MLSYHADFNSDNNPFEMGLDRLVNLDMEPNFIGKASLKKIKTKGVSVKQVGLILNSKALGSPNKEFWPCLKENKIIGKVTSAVYSPRLKENIALAMLDVRFSKIETNLEVKIDGCLVSAKVVEIPFYDPNKRLLKD
jgi:aminomethyltransferase